MINGLRELLCSSLNLLNFLSYRDLNFETHKAVKLVAYKWKFVLSDECKYYL